MDCRNCGGIPRPMEESVQLMTFGRAKNPPPRSGKEMVYPQRETPTRRQTETPDRTRQHRNETVARHWLARLVWRVLCFWQTFHVVYYKVGQLAGTGENFGTANTGCRYDQKPVSHL